MVVISSELLLTDLHVRFTQRYPLQLRGIKKQYPLYILFKHLLFSIKVFSETVEEIFEF